MTKHEENPILYAPKEGVDYFTCWNCYHAICLSSHEHDCLLSDAVWCLQFDELIDSPHEHLTVTDAECRLLI